MEQIAVVGLDLAKRVFQVHGADAAGNPILAQKLRRADVLTFFTKLTAGALTVYLADLKKFFKPVRDLAGMTLTFAQTTVALEYIQSSCRPMS